MADSNPLLASLLMGQRQEENPFQTQRKFGRNLIVQGSSTAPLGSGNPLEGLARALQGGLGGVVAGLANRDEQDQNQYNIGLMSDAAKVALTDPSKATDILKGLKGGGYEQQALLSQIVSQGINTGLANQTAGAQIDARYGAPQTAGGSPQAPQNASAAISGIETGGIPNAGDYRAIGPVADQQGHRAYGKYQVLDLNVAPWTKEVLGHELTPQEFLKDPQAQEAVFKTKFGQLTQQYGPNGAARAWFAGPSGMNNPNASDVNGMTVAQYGNKFDQATGAAPQAPQPQGTPQGQPQQALNVPQGVPQAPPQQGGQVPPMQIPVAQGSQEGARLRAEADRLRHLGQAAAALPLYQQADIADGKNADIRANRDVPGTPAGDVAILQSAIRNPAIAQTPEYAAAFARVGKPQVAMGGQQVYPDMSAYVAPGGGGHGPAQHFQDTPGGTFDMAKSLRKDFSEDPAVKNYLQVKPVFDAMQAVATNPSKAADTNLVAGLVNLYAPGAGSLPREAMFKKIGEIEGIPDQIKTALRSAISGGGMDPQSRQILLDMAQSRLGPMKAEFDARVAQHTERAQRAGVDPRDVLTLPSQGPAASGPITMDAIDAELAKRGHK